MFEAEFAGKLPEISRGEDYLTSCVFGALKYLPPEEGLLPVLRKSIDYSTKKFFQLPFGLEQVSYFFWPKFSDGEPDLVFILSAGLSKFILCVEVKYYSSKSSTGERDQLKRYYEGLEKRREEFTIKDIASFEGEFLGLIYLTQYEAFDEIGESIMAIGKHNNLSPMLFQLRWEDVYRAIEELSKKPQNDFANQIYSDLLRLLMHKNLQYFSGFSEVPDGLAAKELEFDPVFLFKSFSGFPDIPAGCDLNPKTAFLEENYGKN
jgi:hypothetical protein